MKKILLVICAFVMVLTFTACNKKDDKFANKIYANIEVKNYGTIELELYPDVAPETVANFVDLVEYGIYNNTTFHRVMSGFMIQGGDPSGTGRGGTNYKIKGEFLANGFDNVLSHTRGVISMARDDNDYNSASAQFFITHQDRKDLDGHYAAFGKVIKGIEIVDKICANTKVENDNGTVLKENQPIITKIYIVK